MATKETKISFKNLNDDQLKAIKESHFDLTNLKKELSVETVNKMQWKEIALDKMILHEIQFHSEDETSLLLLSEDIAQKGLKSPMILSKNNVVLSGNSRVKALKKLGFTSEIFKVLVNPIEIKSLEVMTVKEQLEFRNLIRVYNSRAKEDKSENLDKMRDYLERIKLGQSFREISESTDKVSIGNLSNMKNIDLENKEIAELIKSGFSNFEILSLLSKNKNHEKFHESIQLINADRNNMKRIKELFKNRVQRARFEYNKFQLLGLCQAILKNPKGINFTLAMMLQLLNLSKSGELKELVSQLENEVYEDKEETETEKKGEKKEKEDSNG